jgi:hypothetical protein
LHIYIYIYIYIISSLSAGKPRSLLERTATSRLSRAPAGPGAGATISKKPAPIAPPLELAKKPLLTQQALGFLMETLEVLGVEKDVSRLFQATGAFPKSSEFCCNLRN